MIALAVVAVLLIAGGIAVYVAFVSDDSLPTRGPSMRPTLRGHAPVDVDVDAYAQSPPARGDIVTAQAPIGVHTGTCGVPARPGSPCPRPDDQYARMRVLKRVVALPGDTVAFTPDGHLILNGRRQPEPYINPCHGTCALPTPMTVPPDHYFLAGDNRPISSDSRLWGPVAAEAIDGRVCGTGAQDCPSD